MTRSLAFIGIVSELFGVGPDLDDPRTAVATRPSQHVHAEPRGTAPAARVVAGGGPGRAQAGGGPVQVGRPAAARAGRRGGLRPPLPPHARGSGRHDPGRPQGDQHPRKGSRRGHGGGICCGLSHI
eukprot:scaffold109729_cov40-Prasinocladus_malaysianus.AAC.1